eukprot:4685419-Alexandrium_andersonii.AAC.1
MIVESRGPTKGEGKGPFDNLTPRGAEAAVRMTAEALGEGGQPELVRPAHARQTQSMLRTKQKGGQPDMLETKQKGGKPDGPRPKPQWVPKETAKGGEDQGATAGSPRPQMGKGLPLPVLWAAGHRLL